MFLVILGFILIAFSFVLAKANNSTKGPLIMRFVAALLIIFGFIWSFVVIIQPGEVGVKKLFGKVDETHVLTEGLNFINPLVDVVKFDVRTQNYTMAEKHDEGDYYGNDAIKTLSADGLELTMDITVLYKVVPTATPTILKSIGIEYKDRIVRPMIRTKIRDMAANYNAVDLYSTKRNEFQAKIYDGITNDFKSRGLILEQVLIRNIVLPVSVKNAIESKINAEQEAQKMEFVLQKEKQEAERKRVEAQGIADYHKTINTGLTEKQLQYEQIKMQKELSTSPNSKIIIMGGGKGMPLILNGN